LKKNKLNKRSKLLWIVYPLITLILMAVSYIAGYSNTSSKDYIRGRSDGLEEGCKQAKQTKLQEDSGKPVSPASDKPQAIPNVIDNQSKESQEDKKNEDNK